LILPLHLIFRDQQKLSDLALSAVGETPTGQPAGRRRY
jgi:hypothetical protein